MKWNNAIQEMTKNGSTQHRGALRLITACGFVAFTWLIALPWVAARRSMDARLRWLQEKQIDPSAMYYTELDAMQPILKRLESRHEHGER
ncbi:MAG: hypothetical protein R3C05_24675 [Pirellulaceae bacterium]